MRPLLLVLTLVAVAACDSAAPNVEDEPPTIRITSPAPGDTLQVGFGASGTARVGYVATSGRQPLTWISLRLDGAQAGYVSLSGAYGHTGTVEFGPIGWPAEGHYTLTLVVSDASGTEVESGAQSVFVDEVPSDPFP